MFCNNTSGTTGVGLDKKETKGKTYLSWVATWFDLYGKKKVKRFSISKYGDEQSKQLAMDFRNDKIKELNTLGAGYSERHGS